MEYSYTILIFVLPLVSFSALGLFARRWKPAAAGLVGTGAVVVSTVLSYAAAYQYCSTLLTDGRFGHIEGFSMLWLRLTASLEVHLGILLDPLSIMMLVVITTVSLMVHIYSLGYMKGEPGFQRYFSFLSLFTFSMLGLVVATNLFQLYIFWELVGVSSYLLIGFYYERPAAVAAAKKAFIVTRFADFGFLIGILMLSYSTNCIDLTSLTAVSPMMSHPGGFMFMGLSATTWALLLIFMGGAGKSAMFPLHIWLPDAMEGPTPVSALIHAATMVVAGVYLVARLFPLYSLAAPDALEVIMYVGSFTSLFAAVIACTQTDIKRVLAYSTLSQIGYMMVALGVSGYGHDGGGYSASLFHLFTHAFFKALLFLGAGSIIHAVHTNQVTEMGGLRKSMPITHVTFLVACLAISGIPPLSGFFSKEEILLAALDHNLLIFGVQWLVAGITAFYMFRLYFRVFWYETPDYSVHPHEAPATMAVPMILLAFASIFAGFVPFHDLITTDGRPLSQSFHPLLALASVCIALVGLALAWRMYLKPNSAPERLAGRLKGLYAAAYRKFYIDEVYLFITRNIMFGLLARSTAWVDRYVVDGAVNLVGDTTTGLSLMIRKIQSGEVQEYIWFFSSGALILALIMLYII